MNIVASKIASLFETVATSSTDGQEMSAKSVRVKRKRDARRTKCLGKQLKLSERLEVKKKARHRKFAIAWYMKAKQLWLDDAIVLDDDFLHWFACPCKLCDVLFDDLISFINKRLEL